jgi:hypothetical protein
MEVRTDDQVAGIVKFDLGQIPSGATVQHAVLELYEAEHIGPRAVNVGAYQVYRNWDQNSVTWNHPWASPGCNDTNHDRAPYPAHSATMSSANQWYAFNLTALVQTWVRDPGQNHGVVLKTYGEPGGVKLVTSDHGGAWMRPKLTLHYTP